MHVDEVDRSGPGVGQYSEIVADRIYRTKGAQGAVVRIVSAGNIRLHADSRPQWRRGKAVTSVGCHRPRTDSADTETAELPDTFIVEIPIGFLGSRRTPETR